MWKEVQNLEFVLQQVHTALMARTIYEANDIVANSRQSPLKAWQRGQKRYDPTTGGRKRHLFCTIIYRSGCSLLELQAGIERWESYVSRYEKKVKSKLDDEIKLAGLGALVPEELEKHWILNMNHLRIFEDVRLEIVTNDEAKVCLRIRDAKPGDTGSDAVDSDPMDRLTQSRFSGSSSPRDGCFKCGHVQRVCNARKGNSKQSSGKKAIRVASRGPRVREKEKGKENNGQSREKSKGDKGAKQSNTGKGSTTGLIRP